MRKILKFDDFVNESLSMDMKTNIYNIFFIMLRIIDRKESRYHLTGGPMIDEDRLPDEDDLQLWMDYADSESNDGSIRFKVMNIGEEDMNEIREKYLDYIPGVEYDDDDYSMFSVMVSSFIRNYDDIRDCFDWMTL